MDNTQPFLQPGVLTGLLTHQLFQDAKARNYALPAVNVVDLHGIHAALEAATEERSPIILQFSYGGALFLGGQGLLQQQSEEDVAALGAILGAKYVHEVATLWNVPIVLHTDHAPKVRLGWLDKIVCWEEAHFGKRSRALFSSHMIDLSLEPLNENLKVCTNYFKRLKALDQLLEIEVGCTGGEEDGLGRSVLGGPARLYSDPESVAKAFQTLMQVGEQFTIAAAFGNVHGVYAPGSVKLNPNLLDLCQKYIAEKLSLPEKPASFVFHGSSGSALKELKKSIEYGVVKVNIDTDTQWAQWEGLLKYFRAHESRLLTQVGTSDDPELPNKKFYDPRVWLRESEQGMKSRIKRACRELGSSNKCL